MSKRHRSADQAPVPRAEIRAHARGERHRVTTELHAVAGQVSAGLEPDDVDEPGEAFRPVHHHDAERALKKANGRPMKHWKFKEWKRRSTVRRARARAMRAAVDEI